MSIIKFLNNQITVPEAPDLKTERINPSYVPEVGQLGIDMDGQLSDEIKNRVASMADTFPYDGMTPEEVGAIRAMAEVSGDVVKSADEYVKHVNKIGGDMSKLYGLEAQHKANFMKHDLALKQVDEQHIGTIADWQQKTNQIVSSARAKVAYLKASRGRVQASESRTLKGA